MGAIFSVIPFLVFLFIVVSVVRSAMKVARKLNEQAPPRMPPANFDPAEAQRTRRIQEEIRRKIAERRGGRALTPPQRGRIDEVFVPRPEPVAPPPSEEPPALASNAAILERQRQLAEQMRLLAAARQMEQRKADRVTAITDSENAQLASNAVMRDDLLAGLRDPAMARRAILLREILGTPVGLR